MRTQKRFLDIQPVLQEYQGGLARIAASGESRADEVDGRGKDIRHVLGAKHHIIEWLLDTLPNEIRDTVADFFSKNNGLYVSLLFPPPKCHITHTYKPHSV